MGVPKARVNASIGSVAPHGAGVSSTSWPSSASSWAASRTARSHSGSSEASIGGVAV
jgi:hypothetical protein